MHMQIVDLPHTHKTTVDFHFANPPKNPTLNLIRF